jgi:hypothetical protein
MIVVDKKINLSQLDKEYNSEGLYLHIDNQGQTIVSLTENNNGNENDLQKAIDKHIAIDEIEIQAQAKAAAIGKLTALGLTTDDLRALGL